MQLCSLTKYSTVCEYILFFCIHDCTVYTSLIACVVVSVLWHSARYRYMKMDNLVR